MEVIKSKEENVDKDCESIDINRDRHGRRTSGKFDVCKLVNGNKEGKGIWG